MKSMNVQNARISESSLEPSQKTTLTEEKNAEFQSFLAGFSHSELATAQLTQESMEESSEPTGNEEETDEMTIEMTEPEMMVDAKPVENQVTEPVEDLISSNLAPTVTVEEQVMASFFNPMPLRSIVSPETMLEMSSIDVGVEGSDSLASIQVGSSLQSSETTIQGLGTEGMVVENPIITPTENQTVTSNVGNVESETSAQVTATKLTVETKIISQPINTSAKGLEEVKQTESQNQVNPLAIEIPSSLLPKSTAQPLSPVANQALSQVAEKLGQPIVQKVTTMNQGSTQKLTVELLPERLGKVEVTIQVTNNKIQLEFVVQNSQTRQLLETMKPRLEQIMHKQEFQEVMQGKVTEAAPVASSDLNQASLSDQSGFHQGFQQERRQQSFGQTTNKGKTFSEIAAEKQPAIEKGSVDILA